MEFAFSPSRIFNLDSQGMTILNGKELASWGRSARGSNYGNRFGAAQDSKTGALEQIGEIIDRMGEASARAQKLPQTITTMGRFSGSAQRLYLKVSERGVEGLLKVGEKNLFYRDFGGRCKEMMPLCVLDFYVHESTQRKGIGNLLFMKMLEHEGVPPNKIAYDRPSTKLQKFLEKHYDLVSYVPQNNNFVIFDAYWKVEAHLSELQNSRESPKCCKKERSN